MDKQTPKTDAAQIDGWLDGVDDVYGKDHWVSADFARQLETELAAALNQIEDTKEYGCMAAKFMALEDKVERLTQELADANARAEAAERKYHLSELNFNAHEKLLIKAESRLRSSVELLKESLSAIEEIHTDNCSAWCGYRELRGKIRDALNLDAIAEEMK